MKAVISISFTLRGRLIFVRATQFINEPVPSLSRLSPKITSLSDLLSAKASVPILTTPLPIFAVTRPVFLNA